MKKIDLIKIVNKVIQEEESEKIILNEAENCKCADGRVLTRGPKPNGVGPYDCNSLRNTGCEGCCSGGRPLSQVSGKAATIKGRNTSKRNADEPVLRRDTMDSEINVDSGIPHFTYPERHSGYLEENKNNLTNNKMAKENLNERFQELAGIKPLYEGEDNVKEMDKEEVYEMLMNEGPELWTALGGLMSVLGAAGIVTSLEMLVQDEAMKEKYPKLAKMFDILAKVGGAVGKGIK